MILNEYVNVEWKRRNRKQYEELGYIFTDYGDTFNIKIKDIPNGSHYKVDYRCDNCERTGTISYKDYLKSLVNGKKYCRSCAAKLLSSTKRNSQYLNSGERQTFYDYICNQFGREYFEEIWDYDKNTLNPNEIFASSKSKVWIKCSNKEHESYEISTNDYHNGKRCPYCSGLKICESNSLSNTYDKSNKMWSDKNIKSPKEYTTHSNKIVWWKCENHKHPDYQRRISNSVRYDFRCPFCVQELNCSVLQNAVEKYISDELKYKIAHEFECTIIPVNPKTGKQLPFDNEVVDLKLIIEVNGKQHYDINGFNVQQAKKNNITPQEQLDYQKWKDEYKCNYALEHGYFYLEIPYTAYENEIYKTLIDEKIKEIVNMRCRND